MEIARTVENDLLKECFETIQNQCYNTCLHRDFRTFYNVLVRFENFKECIRQRHDSLACQFVCDSTCSYEFAAFPENQELESRIGLLEIRYRKNLAKLYRVSSKSKRNKAKEKYDKRKENKTKQKI